MILAIDQGTTSSRSILFDSKGKIQAIEQQEFRQIYPQAAWVEQDPLEIWLSQYNVVQKIISKHAHIRAIGITNQRETTLIWDKKTAKPIYNAIVWQDRRTASYCEELKQKGYQELIQKKTGLLPDAYFSATKIKWILDQDPSHYQRAKNGELCFGTVDSWILFQLTGGKVHATDMTNASRTMIYNIFETKWDEELLELFDIPKEILPQVFPSSHYFGHTDSKITGYEIPITAMIGDQQAALFGQRCWEAGMAKNTYGTGCFMLMNTGEKACTSKQGLLTTIAWGLDSEINYALEGSVFIAGAAIQWLRDELKLIDKSTDSEHFAQQVEDNGGVYLVPAFAGLGAPYWDMYARGTLVGMTRGTNKNHIIRAALESMAYQTKDVLVAMELDAGLKLQSLKVDGAATENQFLMQFQSDLLGVNVDKAEMSESTALGAAFLAGLQIHFWTRQELQDMAIKYQKFEPSSKNSAMETYYKTWKKAIAKAASWIDLDEKNRG